MSFYARLGGHRTKHLALQRLRMVHAAYAAPHRNAQRATGTDDVPLRLVGADAAERRRCTAGRLAGEQSRRTEKNTLGAEASAAGHGGAQATENTGFATGNGRGGIRTRGTGLGPYAALAKRCLQPLGHPTTQLNMVAEEWSGVNPCRWG